MKPAGSWRLEQIIRSFASRKTREKRRGFHIGTTKGQSPQWASFLAKVGLIGDPLPEEGETVSCLTMLQQDHTPQAATLGK